jgi:hypothetical protein
MAKLSVLPALLVSNAAGIMALAVRLPVFSSAKASYFLNSLPAFAIFLGLGATSLDRKHRAWRWILGASFGLLFAIVIVHVLQIAHSLLANKPG